MTSSYRMFIAERVRLFPLFNVFFVNGFSRNRNAENIVNGKVAISTLVISGVTGPNVTKFVNNIQ